MRLGTFAPLRWRNGLSRVEWGREPELGFFPVDGGVRVGLEASRSRERCSIRPFGKQVSDGWHSAAVQSAAALRGYENAQIGLAGIFSTGYVVYGGAVPGAVGSYANKHGNWL